ncbi:hypothetical protein NUW54_g7534 [Trametes sanguinea]|uniref:Uncharacterized protein n=1 Tax=Trametes sanguinea TaxID=158606 RepID=A0ACC1PLW3_9APHY|nr:hypothetical protein NUW54_g7534 [Trametes sanguinea]
MPLDVIYMIMESLEPRDLLSLARTTKLFRGILMNRSKGHPLWRAAIANVEGFPLCPPYMAEPAYVHLMFNTNCHACSRVGVTSIDFPWGVRYCKKCRSDRTIPVNEANAFVRQVVKATGVERPFYAWRGYLHILEVEQFRSEWEALEGDVEARKSLAQRSAEHVIERSEHTVACQDWLEYLKSIRKVKSRATMASRLNDIKQRLQNEGYERELMLVSDHELGRQPFAKKGGLLTDRTWEKIKDAVFDYMEERLEQHIRREREKTIHPRLKMFLRLWEDWKNGWDGEAYDPFDPKAIERMRPGDFLMMDPIRTLIEAPQESVVGPRNLRPFKATLGALVRQWHDAQSEKLALLVKTSIPQLAAHADPLSLAISCFSCAIPGCSKTVLYYPEILGHRCWEYYRYHCEEGTSYQNIVEQYLWREHCGRHWAIENVRVNTPAVGCIPAILRACGFDPLSAQLRRVTYSGHRMTCGDCAPDPEYGYEVFNFRRAIDHQGHPKHRDALCNWVVLPEETAQIVRKFERDTQDSGQCGMYSRRTYFCSNKIERRFTCYVAYQFEDMVAHVRSAHGVEGEVSDEHYTVNRSEETNGLLHKIFLRHTASSEVEVMLKDRHVV